MKEHPVRFFFDQGIRCTLSTDDTFSFGNSLTDEYEALAEYLAFTAAELAQIAKNGFEVADVEDDLRNQALIDIDRLASAG
jgi:adenosine deaminase